MLCIDSQSTSPFNNLAAEEIFLKNRNDDFFMIWQSEPSVIVGKHQNTLAEIDLRFVREKGIHVARRLTGGGTVYHDQGNINFSFIRRGEQGRLVDFSSFIKPVIDFLEGYGLTAVQGPKHEIMAADRKISGNAEHVYKTRVLHHGTLLFDADLQILRNSINHKNGRYTDKSVQSNRSSVININRCLTEDMDVCSFKSEFFRYITDVFGGDLYIPGEGETEAIRRLEEEKYRSWEWIFGWSPDYAFTNKWENGELSIRIELNVHKGTIENCILECNEVDVKQVVAYLTGKRHDEVIVRDALTKAALKSILDDQNLENLVFAFF